MSECVDHGQDFGDCSGPVSDYYALSGSGDLYPRCEWHYRLYVSRVQPRIDEVRSRYPDSDTPPDWFDPTYAGERWNEGD